MSYRLGLLLLPLLAVVLLLPASRPVVAVSVMSIDLGTEWIKVGIVSPGVPLDMALNRESKRKTPAAIAFRDGTRQYGDEALVTAVRFPAASFSYLLPLLGRQLQHPAVQLFASRFGQYQLLADAQRDTVQLQLQDGQVFSAEELLAMMLAEAKAIASSHVGQTGQSSKSTAGSPAAATAGSPAVTDAVIVVPAYWGESERRALLQTAQLAGIKPLQLINDNAAVALNYGMFRRDEFLNTSITSTTSTVSRILFVDIGAGHTSATVAAYSQLKTREHGLSETNPQLQIVGYSYDSTMGGLEMTLRLRNHLADKFMENTKTGGDIYSNQRAMSKLFKEAERVKKILSANAETYAQVEHLVAEESFRQLVTREQLELRCQDMFVTLTQLVEQATSSAGLQLSDIDQLMLVGGASRVPRVKDTLQSLWGPERALSQSVNADEAAALGAVYRAADLSSGFRVKKFHVRDRVHLPIVVDFERDEETVSNEAAATAAAAAAATRSSTLRRNLFTLGNPYPQKKVITFNRHTSDFDFAINLGSLDHLSQQQISEVGGLNLSHVTLKGVTEAFATHMTSSSASFSASSTSSASSTDAESTDNAAAAAGGAGAAAAAGGGAAAAAAAAGAAGGGVRVESRGVKVHFRLDDSGLLSLAAAEAVFEKPANSAAAQTDGDHESTLTKLGNAFTSMFSATDGGSSKSADTADTTNDQSSSSSNDHDQPTTTTTASSNNTSSSSTAAVPDTVKMTTVKVPLQFDERYASVPVMNEAAFKTSQKRLADLDEEDRQRARREQARNTLESRLNEAREQLTEKDYQQATSDTERETILETASQLSDWLYEDGFDEKAAVYEQKLTDFEKLTQPVYDRVREHSERAGAVTALQNVLNTTNTQFVPLLQRAVNATVLDQSDTSSLITLLSSTQEWLQSKMADQTATPLTETPKLRVAAIADKYLAIDREIKFLTNKIKVGEARKAKADAEKRLQDQLKQVKLDDFLNNNSSSSSNNNNSDSSTLLSDGEEEIIDSVVVDDATATTTTTAATTEDEKSSSTNKVNSGSNREEL